MTEINFTFFGMVQPFFELHPVKHLMLSAECSVKTVLLST